MRAAAFLLNRYRVELLPMLLLGVIVAATAFLAAAAPRFFNSVVDDGLRHRIGVAQPVERNVELSQIGHLVGGPGLEPVAARGDELEAELPPSVRDLIADRTYFAESANWSVEDPPREQPTWLRFRVSQGVAERVTYVEGRPPTGATSTIPGRRGTLPGEPEDAVVYEVALSTEIARELGVVVGDRMELVPDTEDVLVGQFSSPVRAAADVVGLYTLDHPEDEFWMDDTSLELPTVVIISPNLRLLYGTALLSEDAYPTLIGQGLPARYVWRQFIDAARLDAGTLDTVTSDLRQMQTRYPPFVASLRDADVTTMRTGLLDLLGQFAGERRTAEAVLVTASLGPAAVAAAAVAVVALLIVDRRRRALALVRGRGATGIQLVGSHLVEAVLVAAPAALAAWAAATILVDGRGSAMSAVLAVIVAGGAVLTLTLTALRPALGPLRDADGHGASSSRNSARRIAFEVLVVVVAAGGAYLLRQRGLAGASSDAQLAGVDPLLAAVPVLVGLAVALVTLRVYPLPLRAATWLADGWRGMVPALGLRRAARTRDVGSLPLIVLLVTVAIGAFSSTVFVTVERGQSAAAWQEVGADMTVTPGSRPLPSEFDATQLPGVDAAAAMHADVAVLGGRGGTRVEMSAIDTPAYRDVTAGTGADPDLPRALRDPPGPEHPIPAIVSRAAATAGPTRIRVGDEMEMLVSSRTVNVRVAAVRDSFPGVDPETAWVVVPLGSVRAAAPDRAFAPTAIFLRAPGASAESVQDAMDEVLPATQVTARSEVLATLRRGPLVRGVETGFSAAVAVAVAYAALATTSALVLIAAVRRRETAHLRTLGMTGRGLLGLSVVEHGPAVLTATAVGVALGVGIAWFVAPGLDLEGLIGSRVQVALTVEPAVVVALVATLVGVLAVAIAIAGWIGRRAGLAASTRQGIE